MREWGQVQAAAHVELHIGVSFRAELAATRHTHTHLVMGKMARAAAHLWFEPASEILARSGRQRFQTEFGGASHQLYARMHPELVQNVCDVVDGCLFGDHKLLGDLPVSQTATHEEKNLTFSRRERATRLAWASKVSTAR